MCCRDKTYCGSKVEKHTCGREFTKQDEIEAEAWWGGEDYPLALSDYCSEEIIK